MPRTQIKAKATRNEIRVWIESERKRFSEIGINREVVKTLMIIILAYSAIKISANLPLLYSTLKPETSSDSPSAKSNGVRFVSARVVMYHVKNIGNIMYKGHVDWVWRITLKLNDIVMQRTVSRIRAILTS